MSSHTVTRNAGNAIFPMMGLWLGAALLVFVVNVPFFRGGMVLIAVVTFGFWCLERTLAGRLTPGLVQSAPYIWSYFMGVGFGLGWSGWFSALSSDVAMSLMIILWFVIGMYLVLRRLR